MLHQIGSGVLGPVFRAYDDEHDRLVAVKVFRLDLVPEAAARLVEALKRAAPAHSAESRALVPLDAGFAGTTPYLVTRFADGEGLDVVWRRSEAGDSASTVALLQAMAEAIDAAWEAGLGFGRLHPRDIFVSDDGRVQITGGGVAAALESAGAVLPPRRPYAAPERIDGGAWGRASDVYALAAIADEWLSRRSQHRGPACRAVLDQALSADPASRQETATTLVDGIRAALSPAEARPAVAEPALAVAAVKAVLSAERSSPRPRVVPQATLEFDPPVDAELPAPAIATVPRREAPVASFPWTAVAAVLVAGITIGLVGGYQIGLRQSAAGVAAPAGTETGSAASSPVEAAPEAIAEASAPEAPVPDVRRASIGSAAESSMGTLRVETRPAGARVTIDGRVVGATPINVSRLTSGSHRVRIELAGHRAVDSTVKVVGGEETRLAVTLEQRSGGL